jgi:hypothetical protein
MVTFEDIVTVGGVHAAVTLTEVVLTELMHPPAFVAVTEYVPEARVVTLAMVGFCTAEVKLFGPFQL